MRSTKDVELLQNWLKNLSKREYQRIVIQPSSLQPIQIPMVLPKSSKCHLTKQFCGMIIKITKVKNGFHLKRCLTHVSILTTKS
eukprot:03563.XXX_135477_135166_1 [CDS] Oithona nana genome sequencing.